jgi:hypothetical protein
MYRTSGYFGSIVVLLCLVFSLIHFFSIQSLTFFAASTRMLISFLNDLYRDIHGWERKTEASSMCFFNFMLDNCGFAIFFCAKSFQFAKMSVTNRRLYSKRAQVKLSHFCLKVKIWNPRIMNYNVTLLSKKNFGHIVRYQKCHMTPNLCKKDSSDLSPFCIYEVKVQGTCKKDSS